MFSKKLNLLLCGVIASCSLMISRPGTAGEILDHFPQALNDGESYLVYLHGKIIEDMGTRPTHPTFGIYEYEDILTSFANRGFTVIGEVRKPDTDPQRYANYVSDQIRRYRDQGDAELNIVGFSKGAIITLLVSSQLDYDNVKYAILAGCWESVTRQNMQLSGRVLSLYDVSDSVSSCQPLADKSDTIVDFHEETFDTGKSHGLFFKPYPVWQELLFDWLGES